MIPFHLKSRFQFLRRSTNAHGVHSPFVYQFVTQCLYDRKKWGQRKSVNTLLKGITYFESNSVAILDDLETAQTVQNVFPNTTYNPKQFDLLFAYEFDLFHFHQLLAEEKLHNDSVVLVDQIHQNPQRKQAWEALIQSPSITVSIDMYHLGALFIRKEQAKEHFTIRI